MECFAESGAVITTPPPAFDLGQGDTLGTQGRTFTRQRTRSHSLVITDLSKFCGHRALDLTLSIRLSAARVATLALWP